MKRTVRVAIALEAQYEIDLDSGAYGPASTLSEAVAVDEVLFREDPVAFIETVNAQPVSVAIVGVLDSGESFPLLPEGYLWMGGPVAHVVTAGRSRTACNVSRGPWSPRHLLSAPPVDVRICVTCERVMASHELRVDSGG